MIKTPRVALLKSDDADFSSLLATFSRHEYSLRVVHSTAQILELVEDEGSNFDAIVLGLTISGGSSGMSACLNIKSDPMLASTPVIAALGTKERSTIQAYFGAGADVVWSMPIDGDLLYLQIGALARQRRLFAELLQRGQQNFGLESATMNALHSAREAMVLFDAQHQILFINRSAQLLLGYTEQNEIEDLDQFAKTVEPLLSECSSIARKDLDEISLAPRELRLQRLNQQSFTGFIRVVPIRAEHGELVGFVVGFSDAGERTNLTNRLIQAQRLRSLSLIAGAGSLKLLRSVFSQIPVSPVAQLEQLFEREPLDAELNTTLLSLLEVLDLVLTTGSEVKVQIPKEWNVAIRFSDLFQLLGHMILHAIDFAGSQGETVVSAEGKANAVQLMISSESARTTPLLPHDFISEVLEGADQSPLESQEKLLFGLHAAQQIADRYTTTLEFKQSPAKLKIRILLPLAKTAPTTLPGQQGSAA